MSRAESETRWQAAVKEAGTLHEAATAAVQRGNAAWEALSTAHPVLHTLFSLLEKQQKVCSNLSIQFSGRCINLKKSIAALESRAVGCVTSLDEVLELLRQSRVDSSLVADPTWSSLFHFVDVDSINLLKLEIKNQLNGVQRLQERAEFIAQEVTNKQGDVFQRIHTMLLQHGVDHARQEPTSAVETLVARISRQHEHMVASAASFASKRAALDTFYQNVTKGEGSSLTAYEGTLAAVMADLREDCTACQQAGCDLAMVARLAQQLHGIVASAYKSLERYTSLARQHHLTFNNLEVRFQERAISVGSIIEEIGSLTAWYNLFHRGSQELGGEIRRRREELERLQIIVSSYTEQFRKLHADETDRRRAFHKSYGQYLPRNLCPALAEDVPLVTLSPAIITTQLPAVVSPTVSADRSLV